MKTTRFGILVLALVAALTCGGRAELVSPDEQGGGPRAPLCKYLVTVANDYIVDAYRNGKKIPDEQRELVLERFGATVEKIHLEVMPGDWLVFHVVHNRLRWDGSKYFAVAGCLDKDQFGFVSDPASPQWSRCDDPAKVAAFIKSRDNGTKKRALVIDKPWSEGDPDMKEYAGDQFPGKALWGDSPSTWIKYIAPGGVVSQQTHHAVKKKEDSMNVQILAPKHWPVQILSAIYGTGGKDADVTARVKEHVEEARHMFSVNPTALGADPNPYWNKTLHVVYIKDGVQRQQWRNENEYVLPESFYGPQDAAELRTWLVETRWIGAQPDIQFHADRTFTSPGVSGTPQWEAIAANKVRLTWAEDHKTEFVFDYTWSSFSEVDNAKNVYHLKK